MARFLRFFLLYSLSACCGMVVAQDSPHRWPSQGNPVVPGYFADPTIKKIGDTYYLYATTDGNGGGLGPSQVWKSTDFVHWTIQPMNWPTTHWYWAPDMTKGYDGRYYLYYSQPVELFGAVSNSPVGPWTSLVADNKPFVPNYMIPGVITLDGQTFTDDDGKIYMFWGTWGIYPGHGCAVGLLNNDMKSFERTELIPNTTAKDFFEAPLMFKRNGIYYLLYSSGHCEDDTYRVQYVKSRTGPFGPYEYPAGNPILATTSDGSIHGPGHNGILEEGGKVYIVYHRHNNPHSGGGFHRQVAADELHFDEQGNIKKLMPTHKGIGMLAKSSIPYTDLAFGKKVTASSFYSAEFRASFAVDNNNGTLWRAANNRGSAWLTIDLGTVKSIGTVLLEMEYPTYAYQYAIEVSKDGQNWAMFSDNRTNDRWASPIVATGDLNARYVRLTIHGTQLQGLPRGVWNVKVYSEKLQQQTVWSAPQPMPRRTSQDTSTIFSLQASSYNAGEMRSVIQNSTGTIGSWKASAAVPVKNYQGRRAFYLDGKTQLHSDFAVPNDQQGNASYTLCMWVNNPDIERIEPIVSWSRPGHDLTLATFGMGIDPARGVVQHGGWADMSFSKLPQEDTWHQVVITFDGYMERLYVDGKLEKEQNKMLFVQSGKHFTVGAAGDDFFSGYIASLTLERHAWTAQQIENNFQQKKADYLFALETADRPIGPIDAMPVFDGIRTSTVACEDGRISVIAGRTGLLADHMEATELLKMIGHPDFTMEMDVFLQGAWKHIVLSSAQGKVRLWENGIPTVSGLLTGLLQKRDGFVSWEDCAVHAIRVYRDSLSEAAIQALYAHWRNSLDGKLVNTALQADGVPYYINPDNLFVSIKPGSPLLRYLFSFGEQQSDWKKMPFHLFQSARKPARAEVRVRDVYGNVGKPIRIKIAENRPIDLFRNTHDQPWTMDSKLSFWDGMRIPNDRDSTALKIKHHSLEWTLASKDTKLDIPGWQGPFLYKEMIEDFTFELQVVDVAGLRSATRTSSEAGILIQDPANPRSYLNNTVLTGWNLGNLVRFVTPGQHVEKNVGNGLVFEPFLQVQRRGSRIYLRSSTDGSLWTDLPGSPFSVDGWAGKNIRVGIYQTANNNQLGYGIFKSLKLWR
ncbi:family 43 glycosylhydrolase [Sphingobacterium suaedae]|uniref:Family 43 glycosylhydrolase n=1 Tax=Sphingobacterium suaedae TaxID=1686402 RepID=A0ABW5KL97_9SPHI